MDPKIQTINIGNDKNIFSQVGARRSEFISGKCTPSGVLSCLIINKIQKKNNQKKFDQGEKLMGKN